MNGKPDEGKVLIRVRRQDAPGAPRRWEYFAVPLRRGMNVITALQDICENPVTADGAPTTPVAWDCNCLEEVCGACTMIINGKARQACSTLVDTIRHPIVLEPMSRFPVVRDLVVDRSAMFEALKRVRAWIPFDGTHDQGAAPRMSHRDQQTAYPLSRCMTCGCCIEACPQCNPRSQFIGPAAINQVRLFNMHPTGRFNAHERLEAVMGPGGVTDCGNAQNCEDACPKNIPLISSIAEVNRATTLLALSKLLGRK
ncbi:MAG: succinate dehydrogenase iron-sulfur subunit [bacterium]